MTDIDGIIERIDWISNNNEPPKYDAVQPCHATAVLRLKNTGDAEGNQEDTWRNVGGVAKSKKMMKREKACRAKEKREKREKRARRKDKQATLTDSGGPNE